MATENKRMRQLQTTEADWANTNPTLLDGEIAFSSDVKDFKVGPGLWASLPYWQPEVDDVYLPLDGGTMRGWINMDEHGLTDSAGTYFYQRGAVGVSSIYPDPNDHVVIAAAGGAAAIVEPAGSTVSGTKAVITKEKGDNYYLQLTGTNWAHRGNVSGNSLTNVSAPGVYYYLGTASTGGPNDGFAYNHGLGVFGGNGTAYGWLDIQQGGGSNLRAWIGKTNAAAETPAEWHELLTSVSGDSGYLRLDGSNGPMLGPLELVDGAPRDGAAGDNDAAPKEYVSVAPHSETETYEVDDFCSFEGVIYHCVVAHSAEPFNLTNWRPTSAQVGTATEFQYDWTSVTAGQVPSGGYGINNTDPTLATQVRVSIETRLGFDVANFWDSIGPGDVLIFEENTGGAEWNIYQADDPGVLVGGNPNYYEIPVTYIGSDGVPENNRQGTVSYVQNPSNQLPAGGDTGDVLAKASTGDFDTEWADLDIQYLRLDATNDPITGTLDFDTASSTLLTSAKDGVMFMDFGRTTDGNALVIRDATLSPIASFRMGGTDLPVATSVVTKARGDARYLQLTANNWAHRGNVSGNNLTNVSAPGVYYYLGTASTGGPNDGQAYNHGLGVFGGSGTAYGWLDIQQGGGSNLRAWIGKTNAAAETPAEWHELLTTNAAGDGYVGQYPDRATFIANPPPAAAIRAIIRCGNLSLAFERDVNGNITDDNGDKWGPSGKVFLQHFGDNVTPGVTDMVPAIAAARDWIAANQIDTGKEIQLGGEVVGVGGTINWATGYGVEFVDGTFLAIGLEGDYPSLDNEPAREGGAAQPGPMFSFSVTPYVRFFCTVDCNFTSSGLRFDDAKGVSMDNRTHVLRWRGNGYGARTVNKAGELQVTASRFNQFEYADTGRGDQAQRQGYGFMVGTPDSNFYGFIGFYTKYPFYKHELSGSCDFIGSHTFNGALDTVTDADNIYGAFFEEPANCRIIGGFFDNAALGIVVDTLHDPGSGPVPEIELADLRFNRNSNGTNLQSVILHTTQADNNLAGLYMPNVMFHAGSTWVDFRSTGAGSYLPVEDLKWTVGSIGNTSAPSVQYGDKLYMRDNSPLILGTQINAPDGTDTFPSFAFKSDPTKGIYLSGASIATTTGLSLGGYSLLNTDGVYYEQQGATGNAAIYPNVDDELLVRVAGQNISARIEGRGTAITDDYTVITAQKGDARYAPIVAVLALADLFVSKGLLTQAEVDVVME